MRVTELHLVEITVGDLLSNVIVLPGCIKVVVDYLVLGAVRILCERPGIPNAQQDIQLRGRVLSQLRQLVVVDGVGQLKGLLLSNGRLVVVLLLNGGGGEGAVLAGCGGGGMVVGTAPSRRRDLIVPSLPRRVQGLLSPQNGLCIAICSYLKKKKRYGQI